MSSVGRSTQVVRLRRAAERPARVARRVQQVQVLAGQVQLQGRYLEQHVEAGSVTPGMAHSVRVGIWRLEQRLEWLVDELGAQHVELAEVTDLLDGLGIEQGEGRWSA